MIIPHLVVNGAAEALEFYKRAFGLVETCRIPTPDGKIMHAAMDFGSPGGPSLFMADEFPNQGNCKSPRQLGGTTTTLHLVVPDVDAAFKRAVDAGAKPLMPPSDMFWGDRYCQVADPFGHHWSIATHKEKLSNDEIARRGQEMAKRFAAKR